jgi:hypothetical protein
VVVKEEPMAQLVTTPETVGVKVRCPSCGETGILPVHLASRLVMVEGENSKLGVRARAVALPHLCGQLTIEEALRELEGDEE